MPRAEPNGTRRRPATRRRSSRPNAPPVAIAERLEVGPAGLAIPVAGVKPDQLTDTFTQARAGGAAARCDRHHGRRGHAGDRRAPGTIEKLFFTNGGGGITVYVRSADQRWTYYYAHLSGYAPGLAEGQQVSAARSSRRVGHTGDANAAGPHLHFAINRMAPGERWWQGTPINPYPLLAGKKAERLGAAAPALSIQFNQAGDP